jgi:WS/DGAT/MGAT family acyltransferase
MNVTDSLLWTVGRDPVLRTTIVAVLLLDRAPQWAEVHERMRSLTLTMPRFRSRANSAAPLGWGRPVWVDEGGFDLALHLRRIVAPPPATLRSVLDLAQVMGTTAFDPELPLWEAVVVEGLEAGHAALVIKLHHAVVDGVGGIAVLLDLLDRQRTTRRGVRVDHRPVDLEQPVDEVSGTIGVGRRLRTVLGGVIPVSRRIVGTTVRAVSNPGAQFTRTWATAESVGRLLAPARHPLSPLMTARSLGRRFEAFDLSSDLLRRTAEATGTTLNDVFLTGVLGGLRRYHLEHGIEMEQLRVLMPVNVRNGSHAVGGNHFVPARFALPTLADPAERLRRVHDIAGSWKHAPGLGMSDSLAAALCLLPAPVTTSLWGSMLKGDDFVVTNVPGPPFETYLAGAHVERFFGFAPTSGAALNVALLTPAGRSCVGVNIDTAAIPDGDALLRCLREEFDEVCRLAPSPLLLAQA